MSNDETKKKNYFFKNDLKKRPNLNQVNFQN
jgi:hypothetical protein